MERVDILGSRLQELRISRRLTQKAVCHEIGTSQQNLSRYEKNVYLVPIDILVKLSKYYNVSADYILGLSDEKRGIKGSFPKDEEVLDFIDVYSSFSKAEREYIWHMATKLRDISIHSK